MSTHFQKKSKLYKLLKNTSIKYGRPITATWRSSLDDIKKEIVKMFPNKNKAEKIIKQIEKSKPKIINPSTYSVGEFFENVEKNRLYLIDISFEWKVIEEKDWLPSETQFRSNISNANQQTLLSKARSAALEYAHRRTQPQYDIDVRNIVIENVDEIKNENDFSDIPFYRSDIFNYRNLSLIEWFLLRSGKKLFSIERQQIL